MTSTSSAASTRAAGAVAPLGVARLTSANAVPTAALSAIAVAVDTYPVEMLMIIVGLTHTTKIVQSTTCDGRTSTRGSVSATPVVSTMTTSSACQGAGT